MSDMMYEVCDELIIDIKSTFYVMLLFMSGNGQQSVC